MKAQKISVNKTAEKPDGVEIEIIQPETDLEKRLIAFLLGGMLREIKRNNQFPYEVPDNFNIEHGADGTFVLTGFPSNSDNAPGFYQPPRPLAVVGIRQVGTGFDLVHAAVNPSAAQPATAAPATA